MCLLFIFLVLGCVITLILVFTIPRGGSSSKLHSPESSGQEWGSCYDWFPLKASWDDAKKICELRNQTLSSIVPDEIMALLINNERGLLSEEELLASPHYQSLQSLVNETGKLPTYEANKFGFFRKNYESIFEEDERRIWTSNKGPCYSMIMKQEDLSYKLQRVKCSLNLAYICQYWHYGTCPTAFNVFNAF